MRRGGDQPSRKLLKSLLVRSVGLREQIYWRSLRARTMAALAPFSTRTFLTWARWAAESGRMALM